MEPLPDFDPAAQLGKLCTVVGEAGVFEIMLAIIQPSESPGKANLFFTLRQGTLTIVRPAPHCFLYAPHQTSDR